jgi:hypothetical protein
MEAHQKSIASRVKPFWKSQKLKYRTNFHLELQILHALIHK